MIFISTMTLVYPESSPQHNDGESAVLSDDALKTVTITNAASEHREKVN